MQDGFQSVQNNADRFPYPSEKTGTDWKSVLQSNSLPKHTAQNGDAIAVPWLASSASSRRTSALHAIRRIVASRAAVGSSSRFRPALVQSLVELLQVPSWK
jgi:hypothetical protein